MLIVVHIYIWICTRCKSWRKIYLWLHISPYLFKTSGIRLHKFFSSLLLRRIKFITRQFFPSFHKSKSHDQSGTRRLLHGQREYDNRNDLQHGCYPRSRRIEKKKKKYDLHFPFLQSSSFHQRYRFHYGRNTQVEMYSRAKDESGSRRDSY